MAETTRTLTVDEAVAMLSDEDRIHTFLGSIGADWDRPAVIAAIRAAKGRRTTGGMAARLGHGLAVERDGGTLYIQTRKVPS